MYDGKYNDGERCVILPKLDKLATPLLTSAQDGPHYDFRVGEGGILPGKDPANSKEC